jgi:hypothetical protein
MSLAAPEAGSPIPQASPNSSVSLLRHLRDPFKIQLIDGLDNRPRSDLQQVSIDEIKVVGILTGPTRTRAIVRIGAATKTYIVGVGMRMGNDDEVIQKISSNGITVLGNRVNVVGDRELLTTELPLVLESKKLRVENETSINELSPNEGGPGNAAASPAPAPPLSPMGRGAGKSMNSNAGNSKGAQEIKP